MCDRPREGESAGTRLAFMLRTNLHNYENWCFLLSDTLLEDKRSALRIETERVLSLSEAIKDAHILDHALATQKSLAACLHANVSAQSNAEEPSPPTSFVEVDTFAPAQKNETQLRFQRTTHSAGRKQKMVPLV